MRQFAAFTFNCVLHILEAMKIYVCGMLLCAAAGALVVSGDTPAPVKTKANRSAIVMPSPKDDYDEAVRLTTGNENPRSLESAINLYLRSAEAGYPRSQFALGYLYEKGVGLRRDPKLAAVWYRKAADQGLAEAENNLGSCYSSGLGVPKSSRQAAIWFEKAAHQGDTEAQANLADAYFNGRGVERDLQRASRLYSAAAEHGNAMAQLKLAIMYAHGEGVKRDMVQSYVWLDMAAKNIQGAEKIRDKVAETLSAQELTRAKGLAGLKRDDLKTAQHK